jgi:hypothetical protein
MLLPQLEALLQASPRVSGYQIVDNDPIDERNFLFKIRCELTSGQSLQIRLRGIDGYVRYSYQELSDKPLRRWDNAPHFAHVKSFPHHHHDLEGHITESSLAGNPLTDLPQVLSVL